MCYTKQGLHHLWYPIVKDFRGKQMLLQGTLPWRSAWDQRFDKSHKQFCLQQPHSFFPQATQETPGYRLLTEYIRYQRAQRTVPRGKIDLACLTFSYIVTLLTSSTGSLQTAVSKQQEHILRIHTFCVSCSCWEFSWNFSLVLVERIPGPGKTSVPSLDDSLAQRTTPCYMYW